MKNGGAAGKGPSINGGNAAGTVDSFNKHYNKELKVSEGKSQFKDLRIVDQFILDVSMSR